MDIFCNWGWNLAIFKEIYFCKDDYFILKFNWFFDFPDN